MFRQIFLDNWGNSVHTYIRAHILRTYIRYIWRSSERREIFSPGSIKLRYTLKWSSLFWVNIYITELINKEEATIFEGSYFQLHSEPFPVSVKPAHRKPKKNIPISDTDNRILFYLSGFNNRIFLISLRGDVGMYMHTYRHEKEKRG